MQKLKQQWWNNQDKNIICSLKDNSCWLPLWLHFSIFITHVISTIHSWPHASDMHMTSKTNLDHETNQWAWPGLVRYPNSQPCLDCKTRTRIMPWRMWSSRDVLGNTYFHLPSTHWRCPLIEKNDHSHLSFNNMYIYTCTCIGLDTILHMKGRQNFIKSR